MKTRTWFLVTLLVLGAALAVADEPKKMSAEEKAAMEAMMKAMTPGDAHKLLDGMTGSWDTKVTMWSSPGAEPSVNKATSQSKWILGNRVIEEQFSGEFMGMPFTGVGHSGYDNVRKQYWSSWMDNMSTALMTSTGSTSDGGKTWTWTGVNADPMTGKDAKVETRVAVADKDHHVMEMWGPAPDGKMYKMMEIAYTRKK